MAEEEAAEHHGCHEGGEDDAEGDVSLCSGGVGGCARGR